MDNRLAPSGWLACLIALSLCLACIMPVAAQGCSQCRDNVAQSNPAVQASYRTAILVLLGGVATFSIAAFVVVRKMR